MAVTKFLNLDIDNTLGGNSPSDYKIASQRAIKEYTDNELSNKLTGEQYSNILMEEVFKPDVFTAVGSPSITAEGIASNFSISNYIRLPEIDVTGADFEVDLGRVTMPELGHGFQMLTGGNDISHSFIIALQGNTNILYFGSNQRISRTIITDIAVSEGQNYRIKAGRENGVYYLDAALDGGNYTRYESSGTIAALNELRLNIGSSADADKQYYWRGSYDLKQLKITADGQEVFSGSKLIISNE